MYLARPEGSERGLGHQALKRRTLQKFRGGPTLIPKRRLTIFLDKFRMHTVKHDSTEETC